MAIIEPGRAGVDQEKIFVTGSTGELGRLVIGELLRRISPSRIVAGVRSPHNAVAKQFEAQGVEVRVADYAKPETLVAAFQGVDQLLLISSNDEQERLVQHESVISAAKAAQVGLIAYTSLLHADRSALGFGADHRRTEVALAKSGVPHVLLRHGWYMENHLSLISSALKYGAVLGCAADGRFSTAMRCDLAEAAAVVLTTGEHAGRIYELAGDDSYTLADFAAEISVATGHQIVYTDMFEVAYKRMLIEMNLPEAIAALIADADACALRGELEDRGRHLSALIGHPTISLRKAVEEAVRSE